MEIQEQIITDIKEIYINATPTKYRNLIAKHFIPSKEQQTDNAEVSTPVDVVDEMINKIPNNFWEEKRKIYEPCCGKGNIVLGIFEKLYTGLESKYNDNEELCRVIIEECIYFSDKDDTNVFITEEILRSYAQGCCGNIINFKFNSYIGNTLNIDISSLWNLDSFDAIIGNPPFQLKGATGDNKLYLSFIQKALSLLGKNDYLLFIVPTNIKNYITNQDKNRNYFNKFLKIEYLCFNTINSYFKNINTYFSYFLIKNIEVETCETEVSCLRNNKIEHSKIIINKKDNIPLFMTPMDYDIMNKVSNLIQKERVRPFDIKKAKYYKNNKPTEQRIRKEHIKKGDVKTEKNEEFKYPIINKIDKKNPFDPDNNKLGENFYYNKEMIDIGHMKIMMNTGGYLSPSLDKEGKYNISDNMLYMLINNEDEFIGLTKLINSDLVTYLNKSSMTDNIHGRDIVIQKLKSIPLDSIHNDNDIYDLYGLTHEEKQLIEKTIK